MEARIFALRCLRKKYFVPKLWVTFSQSAKIPNTQFSDASVFDFILIHNIPNSCTVCATDPVEYSLNVALSRDF
jgi:hypothetical protein